MKNLLRLLILCLVLSCITTTGWAKEGKPKFKAKPFALTELTEKLPPGFKGDDIKNLAEIISSMQLAKIKGKGEFETTEEYQKKMNKILSGIDMNRIYAFNYNIEKTYDADQLLLMFKDDYFGFTDDNGKITTTIESDESNVRSYIATNAFGAQIKVRSSEKYRYEIAYDEPQIDGLSHEGTLYQFLGHITLPVKEAKALSGKIGVLAICKLDDSSSYFPIEIKSEYKKPTFDMPYEGDRYTITIPVKLLGVWVYNTQTGEIYLKKSATEALPAANAQTDEQKAEE